MSEREDWLAATRARVQRSRINSVRSIPLDHPKVEEAKAIIPQEFWGQSWIAGSAATKWPLAWDKGGDVDVWACNLPEWRIQEIMINTGMNERLDEHGRPYPPATIFLGGGPRLHVIATARSIEEVLGGFDISCHCAATPLIDDGRENVIPTDYQLGIHILRWSRPDNTMIRAFRFAERYENGFDFMWDEMTRRCAIEAFGLEDKATLAQNMEQVNDGL